MKKTIAIYGGSFNPPGVHHRLIAQELTKTFDRVIIVPCGPRPDKPITNDIDSVYRSAMVDMNFRNLPRVEVDLFDLEAATFTRTIALEKRYQEQGEIWHVVGADLVKGGARNRSKIQSEWERGKELWKNSKFVVMSRKDFELETGDIPPKHKLISIEFTGSSSGIRERIYHGKETNGTILPEVRDYIVRHGLYSGIPIARSTRYAISDLKPLVLFDEKNPQAKKLAAKVKPTKDKNPNLILVIGGDGTMLRAIKSHWRYRLPFYGINAGRMGFLLNQSSILPQGELVVSQLPLLWVQTISADGKTEEGLAFNDAWIERATGQTALMQVSVNGKIKLDPVMADGVLVATAAGSSSYSRAMGAPPVPFNTPVLLLVGSNVLQPHFWKSAVLSLDAQVEMKALDPKKRPMNAFLDGVCRSNTECLRIRVSRTAAVELAFDPQYDPSEKLARIQFSLM